MLRGKEISSALSLTLTIAFGIFTDVGSSYHVRSPWLNTPASWRALPYWSSQLIREDANFQSSRENALPCLMHAMILPTSHKTPVKYATR